MNNFTPLRYPGGKSLMTPFFQKLIEVNSMKNVVYAEPYAGGAGAAINLLLSGDVDAIKINDAAVSIYSFWHYLLTEGDRFVSLVENTEVTLDEWQKQRAIFKSSNKPSFELGFATFFLNRTNRSGILGAGPIGGQDPINQKKAKYKLDCRFNKKELINRMGKILEKRSLISISNDDALVFLRGIREKNVLVYLDPPYYTQGKALYMNFYKHDNHSELASFLKRKSKFKWFLSYDNVEEIRNLYSGFDLYQFNLCYTAQEIKNGSELFTHSKDLILPHPLVITRTTESNIILTEINM